MWLPGCWLLATLRQSRRTLGYLAKDGGELKVHDAMILPGELNGRVDRYRKSDLIVYTYSVLFGPGDI